MSACRIVVIGSLNVDFLVSADRVPTAGETLKGTDFQLMPGGKGANQAAGCARLGAEVTLIGAVGADAFGDMLLENLAEIGIGIETIARIPHAATGTAAVLRTQADNRILVIPGANEHCTPEWAAQWEERIAAADLVLLQLEIPLETVRCGIELAHRHNVRVVVNPAPADDIPEADLKKISVFTPNETEFAYYTGMNPDSMTDEMLAERMLEWQDRYGHTLIVTRGAKGCSFIEEGQLRTIPAEKVEVVDTTGAGDAFNAGLCTSLASGLSLDKAIAIGNRVAARVVTEAGAQTALPSLQKLLSNEGLG